MHAGQVNEGYAEVARFMCCAHLFTGRFPAGSSVVLRRHLGYALAACTHSYGQEEAGEIWKGMLKLQITVEAWCICGCQKGKGKLASKGPGYGLVAASVRL